MFICHIHFLAIVYVYVPGRGEASRVVSDDDATNWLFHEYGKRLNHWNDLYSHMATHTKPFNCQYCQHCGSSTHNLGKHMKTEHDIILPKQSQWECRKNRIRHEQ